MDSVMVDSLWAAIEKLQSDPMSGWFNWLAILWAFGVYSYFAITHSKRIAKLEEK